jgi:hypothetical protein
MTKAIAYYLPQFHEVMENNAWWGKGFTEWTNLRKATPLYRGHRQPVQPLNDYYYDLMDRSTVVWQTELAKKYSVDAFNYYHYWFGDRTILEKPAENLLKWKDIEQKFMFMWANHDWTRSWVGGREVLLEVKYGGRPEWQAHLDYLMPFFLDPRYLKIDNKPLFQIYIRPKVPRFEEMVAFWDEECRKRGFAGIYLIDNIDYRMIRNGNLSEAVSAVTLQEQTASVQYLQSKSAARRVYEAVRRRVENAAHRLPVYPFGVRKYSYDRNVAASLELMRKLDLGVKTFFGVCTGWDNTPRYGRRGYVVEGATPEKFRRYLAAAKELSEARNQEYVFIACWNEWCEGMCLEPTKHDGYGYLEAVRAVFGEPVRRT